MVTEEYFEKQGWLDDLCGTEPDPLTEEDLIELERLAPIEVK